MFMSPLAINTLPDFTSPEITRILIRLLVTVTFVVTFVLIFGRLNISSLFTAPIKPISGDLFSIYALYPALAATV